MKQIFESECDPLRKISAMKSQSGPIWIEVQDDAGSYTLKMVEEDAEALARAILGIPDPYFFDWDACVADMKASAALGALDEAKAARRAHILV